MRRALFQYIGWRSNTSKIERYFSFVSILLMKTISQDKKFYGPSRSQKSKHAQLLVVRATSHNNNLPALHWWSTFCLHLSPSHRHQL